MTKGISVNGSSNGHTPPDSGCPLEEDGDVDEGASDSPSSQDPDKEHRYATKPTVKE